MCFPGRILLIILLISLAFKVYCGSAEGTLEDARLKNQSSTFDNGSEITTAAPQNVERFSNGAGTLDSQHNRTVYQQEETSSNETMWETSLNNTSVEVEPTIVRIVFLAQLCLDGIGNKTRTELIKETAGIVTAQQTIDQTNFKLGNDSTYNFELDVQDVCDGDGRLLRTIVENLPECVQNQSCKSRPSGSTYLAGFVGTLREADPATVAIAVEGTNIPIISTEYSLEQGEFDSTNYFSTKTPEVVEVELIVQLARHLEWSYVSLVYTNDSYGNYMAYHAKRLLKEAGICVRIEQPLDTKSYSESKYYGLIDRIRSSEATGIIYLGQETQALWMIELFIGSRSIIGRSKTILGSSHIGRSEDVKRKIVGQNSDISGLKFVAIERLTRKGHRESVHRQALVQSLSRKRPGFFQLLQQLQQNANFNPSKQEMEHVKEDYLARIAFSVQRITDAFSRLQNDTQTTARSSILDLLRNNCRRLDSINEMNYCPPSSSGLLNQFEMSILSPASSDYNPIAIVGNLQNGIKFFNKTETSAMVDESRCISNCGMCGEEMEKPLGYIFIPGSDEHVVVGTAEIHSTDDFVSCGSNITVEGYLSMQAFFLGNQAFQNITKLNYSVLYLDTCASVPVAETLLDKIFVDDIARITDIWGRNHVIPTARFLLIIGDRLTSVSMLLQERFRAYHIPQIATGSQSHWLDDASRYPSLLRLSASNSDLVTAFLLVCKELNITRVVVLFADTPDGISTSSLFESRAKDYQICIQETIRLTKNQTSITEIGQKLAKEESFPRAFLLFSENHFTKILAEAIASKDLIWSQTGRILISQSNLVTIIRPTQTRQFLGSINIHTETQFLAKPDLESEELVKSYLLDYSYNIATHNMWYVHFWQQLGQCYISNLTTMPSEFTLNYTRRCDLSCGLRYREERSCIVNDLTQRLDLESVQVRINLLAWLALAYSVNTHNPVESNHTMLYQRLAESKVPSNTFAPDNGNDRSLLVFNSTTRQARYAQFSVHIMNRFEKTQPPTYSEIFKFTVNENSKKLTAISNNLPIFYRHGEVDKRFESKCSQVLCHCIKESAESIDGNTASILSYIPTPTEVDSNQSGPNKALLPCTIILSLLLVLVTFIFLYRSRKNLPRCMMMKEEEKNRYKRYKIRYHATEIQIEEKPSSTEQERDVNVQHGDNSSELDRDYKNTNGDEDDINITTYLVPNTPALPPRQAASLLNKQTCSAPTPISLTHKPRLIDTHMRVKPCPYPVQQHKEQHRLPHVRTSNQPPQTSCSVPGLTTRIPNTPGQTCNAIGDFLQGQDEISTHQVEVHYGDEELYEFVDRDSDVVYRDSDVYVYDDGDVASISDRPSASDPLLTHPSQISDPIQPVEVSLTTNASPPVSVQDNQTRSLDSHSQQPPSSTYNGQQYQNTNDSSRHVNSVTEPLLPHPLQISDQIQSAEVSITTNASPPVSAQDNLTRSLDSYSQQPPSSTYNGQQYQSTNDSSRHVYSVTEPLLPHPLQISDQIQPAEVSITTNASPPVSAQDNLTRSLDSYSQQPSSSTYDGQQYYYADDSNSGHNMELGHLLPASQATSRHTLVLHSLVSED